MKKDKKIIFILVVLLILTLTLFVGTTYAWLTYQKSEEKTFVMGDIEVKVESSLEEIDQDDEYIHLEINDLAYIDRNKDFQMDNTLFNKFATTLSFTITNIGDVDVRNYVQILYRENDEYQPLFTLENDVVTYNNIPGLLYLVLDESETNYQNTFNTYLGNPTDSNIDINKIEENNFTYLKNMYETEILTKNDIRSFQIVFYGDYYGLSDVDQQIENHLNKTFDVAIKILSIQNEYRGDVTYEKE